MGDTKIEWTDKTWNPLRGCARVSEGCRNCYAMKMAHRQSGPGKAYEGLTMVGADGPQWTGKVRTVPELLTEPLRWRKPRKIFVNSMSDLFHEDVPFEFIHEVWAVMRQTPQHTYQILTKRPERMREVVDLISRKETLGYAKGFYSHVWLGVSVEDQKTADERIPLLLQTPAAVRWISAEPLLGPIDLVYAANQKCGHEEGYMEGNTGAWICLACERQVEFNLDWVIVGGESGHRARPMHPDWVRSIRNQCQAAGVKFFFKQWGAWGPVAPIYDEDDSYLDRIDQARESRCEILDRVGTQWPEFQPPPGSWMMERVGKKNSGRLLDGRTWDEFPV